ncbi:MAG: polyprenyl diphosphate synthase [Phycisphaerales bacterium]|nr:polyprenyl diphosphate synthase [Phycisphaerales bacterium]
MLSRLFGRRPAKPITTGRDFSADPEAQRIAAAMHARNPKADPLGRLPDVHPGALPRHIAIIMDGNGRWATKRALPRAMGHRAGAKTVRTIIEEIGRLGIEVCTLYSFSLENWKRPRDEVEALMKLYNEQVDLQRQEFMDNNIRFLQIGRRDGLPEECLRRRDDLVELTRNNTAGTLVLAVNYGSRAEITDAVRAIARKARDGALSPDSIDESTIAAHLDTAGLPDPDLLIRTAGEMRVSNYLLWQISYAELYVTPTLWPDFSPTDLHNALRAYASRDRKFGGLTDPK